MAVSQCVAVFVRLPWSCLLGAQWETSIHKDKHPSRLPSIVALAVPVYLRINLGDNRGWGWGWGWGRGRGQASLSQLPLALAFCFYSLTCTTDLRAGVCVACGPPNMLSVSALLITETPTQRKKITLKRTNFDICQTTCRVVKGKSV